MMLLMQQLLKLMHIAAVIAIVVVAVVEKKCKWLGMEHNRCVSQADEWCDWMSLGAETSTAQS